MVCQNLFLLSYSHFSAATGTEMLGLLRVTLAEDSL